MNYDGKENEEGSYDGDDDNGSVTDELPAESDLKMHPEVVSENDNTKKFGMEKTLQRTKLKLLCGLSFALLAMATPLVWINSQEEGHFLVPT